MGEMLTYCIGYRTRPTQGVQLFQRGMMRARNMTVQEREKVKLGKILQGQIMQNRCKYMNTTAETH